MLIVLRDDVGDSLASWCLAETLIDDLLELGLLMERN